MTPFSLPTAILIYLPLFAENSLKDVYSFFFQFLPSLFLINPLQSGVCSHHSTKITVINVINNLLIVPVLVLLLFNLIYQKYFTQLIILSSQGKKKEIINVAFRITHPLDFYYTSIDHSFLVSFSFWFFLSQPLNSKVI